MTGIGLINALDFIDPGEHAAIQDFTSTYDATTELQAWLTSVRDNGRKGYIPTGLYKISAPLFVTETAQESCHIEGDGGGYTKNVSLKLSQTIIESSAVDQPILVIQGGRGVRVAHIMLRGQNTAPDAADNDPMDDDSWVTVGYRNTRYSPQCGIAIDPAIGSVPPDGGYPGMTYQVTGGGSALIYIEYMTIEYCVVGIAHSPGGTAVQGEEVRIENCNIHHCDTGASFANGQNRANVIQNSSIWSCRTCITSARHGNQAGSPPYIGGCHFINAYRIFEFRVGQAMGLLESSYAESTKMLGMWGENNSGTIFPMEIRNMDYHFNQNGDGTIEPFILEANAPITIEGSVFMTNDGSGVTLNFSGRSKYRYQGCSFVGGWANNNDSSIAYRLTDPFHTLEDCGINGQGTQQLFAENETLDPRSLEIVISDLNIGTTSLSFRTDSAPMISVGELIFWRILPQGISLVRENTVPALQITEKNETTITARLLFGLDKYDQTNWHGNRLNVLQGIYKNRW